MDFSTIITYLIGGGGTYGIIEIIKYFINRRNEKRKSNAEASQFEANAKQTEVLTESSEIDNEMKYKDFLNSVISDYQKIAEKYKLDAESQAIEKDCAKKQLIEVNKKVDDMDKSFRELTDEFLSKFDKLAMKVNILKTWIEEVTVDTIDALKIKAKTIDYEKL